MSKKFLFGFTIGLCAVIAAVLWLLSVVVPDSFGWFSFGWAVVVFCGGSGIAYVFKGLFSGKNVVLKKWSIYIGAALIVLAILSLISELALSNKLVLPIIAVVVAVALLLGFVAVGGKKWDAGDNDQVGYKTYRQRKAEEEAKKNEENND